MEKEEINIPSPKESNTLYGHESAEKEILAAFASGKLPNAWMISGPKGIGKATLAYRFAKFLLTNKLPSSQSDGLFGDSLAAEIPESMDVDRSNPAVGRILAGSHGDFLVIDTENLDEDKIKKEISVGEARRIGEFLSMTPAESDFRVVIIDSADEMNRNAANAILKILEEPPQNSIIILTSHNPGRLLPTIRSRCRLLKLNPPGLEVAGKILRSHIPPASSEEIAVLTRLSDGSPGLAIQIYASGGLEIYASIVEMFRSFPQPSIKKLHELGNKISSRGNEEKWATATYLLQYFLMDIVRSAVNDNLSDEYVPGENRLKQELSRQASLAKWAELWEKIGQTASETEHSNLDKKHALITMFHTIKSAVA